VIICYSICHKKQCRLSIVQNSLQINH